MSIFKKNLSLLAVISAAASLFMFSVGCDDVIVDPPEPEFVSVVFDDFGINGNDTDFTIQSTLGSKLGAIVGDVDNDGTGDTIAWGGGQWYAYASGTADGDSACVYSFDTDGNADTIVTLAGMEPVNSETDPLKMFGDSTMTVALDAKDAAEDQESGSYYYAAIGCAIAGDPDHLDGATGYTRIEATDAGANSKVDCITWNLTNLVSITIKGQCTGAFTFNFNGVKADSTIGVAIAKVSSPDPATETEIQPLDITIPMEDFVAASWNGGTWDAIKANCHEIAIELNTDATAGGDFASLKLEKILFNFDTQANADAAFPFLVN